MVRLNDSLGETLTVLLSEFPLQQFAGGVARQVSTNTHLLRQLVGRQVLPREAPAALPRPTVWPGRSTTNAVTASIHLSSGRPTTATSETAGMGEQHFLHLPARDQHAAGVDHVADAIDDVQIAFRHRSSRRRRNETIRRRTPRRFPPACPSSRPSDAASGARSRHACRAARRSCPGRRRGSARSGTGRPQEAGRASCSSGRSTVASGAISVWP